MPAVACPHCSAGNPFGNRFCQWCGLAIPRGLPPRVLTTLESAATAPGRVLLHAEIIRRETRLTAAILLIIAIVQLGFGALLILVGEFSGDADTGEMKILVVSQVGVALAFIALAYWARHNPLPAAIVGLVLYASLLAVNITVAISQVIDAPAGVQNLGVGVLDIVFIMVLVQAMAAGFRFHKAKKTPL